MENEKELHQFESVNCRFKESHFVTLPGFAIVHFDLTLVQLAVYSLINGYTMSEGHEFKGSLKYIQDAVKISRTTAVNALRDLVNMDLIIKKSSTLNGVVFNSYRVNQKFHGDNAVNHRKHMVEKMNNLPY